MPSELGNRSVCMRTSSLNWGLGASSMDCKLPFPGLSQEASRFGHSAGRVGNREMLAVVRPADAAIAVEHHSAGLAAGPLQTRQRPFNGDLWPVLADAMDRIG